MSSTRDNGTKIQVEKRLAREESYRRYSSSNGTPLFSSTPEPSDVSPSGSPGDSAEEFTPKRPCTPRSVGTTVEISKDFLKKLAPAADRLEISNSTLASVIAAVTNHGGGDINQLSLSKSTARRHRTSARSEQAATIKRDFNSNVGQINFDGKLLEDLGK